MDKFLEALVNNGQLIFSTILASLFIYAFISILGEIFEIEDARNLQVKQLTEVCYAQDMVLVNTDAGYRCATTKSLVKAH